jgi:hypothetical protein
MEIIRESVEGCGRNPFVSGWNPGIGFCKYENELRSTLF